MFIIFLESLEYKQHSDGVLEILMILVVRLHRKSGKFSSAIWQNLVILVASVGRRARVGLMVRNFDSYA